MTGLLIRAHVEPANRFELVQVFKDTTQAAHLCSGCLERRLYEESGSSFDVMFVERWSDQRALGSYLSSDDFRALIGAIKVLGTLQNVVVFEEKSIESQA